MSPQVLFLQNLLTQSLHLRRCPPIHLFRKKQLCAFTITYRRSFINFFVSALFLSAEATNSKLLIWCISSSIIAASVISRFFPIFACLKLRVLNSDSSLFYTSMVFLVCLFSFTHYFLQIRGLLEEKPNFGDH